MRDVSQKQRTSVAAKAALFSSLSDELRRVIGENILYFTVVPLYRLCSFLTFFKMP